MYWSNFVSPKYQPDEQIHRCRSGRLRLVNLLRQTMHHLLGAGGDDGGWWWWWSPPSFKFVLKQPKNTQRDLNKIRGKKVYQVESCWYMIYSISSNDFGLLTQPHWVLSSLPGTKNKKKYMLDGWVKKMPDIIKHQKLWILSCCDGETADFPPKPTKSQERLLSNNGVSSSLYKLHLLVSSWKRPGPPIIWRGDPINPIIEITRPNWGFRFGRCLPCLFSWCIC